MTASQSCGGSVLVQITWRATYFLHKNIIKQATINAPLPKEIKNWYNLTAFQMLVKWIQLTLLTIQFRQSYIYLQKRSNGAWWTRFLYPVASLPSVSFRRRLFMAHNVVQLQTSPSYFCKPRLLVQAPPPLFRPAH